MIKLYKRYKPWIFPWLEDNQWIVEGKFHLESSAYDIIEKDVTNAYEYKIELDTDKCADNNPIG